MPLLYTNRREKTTPGIQTVKKGIAEQLAQSNSATCAVNLIFPERKRRKNNTFRQDCARKILKGGL